MKCAMFSRGKQRNKTSIHWYLWKKETKESYVRKHTLKSPLPPRRSRSRVALLEPRVGRVSSSNVSYSSYTSSCRAVECGLSSPRRPRGGLRSPRPAPTARLLPLPVAPRRDDAKRESDRSGSCGFSSSGRSARGVRLMRGTTVRIWARVSQ